MDIGTHLATGLIASTFFESPYAKAVCIIGAVAPDITYTPNYIIRYFRKDRSFLKQMKKNGPEAPHPQWERNLYSFAHSFTFLFFLLGMSFLKENIILWAFFIGYLTHVLWDIPTHSDEAANKPLYPFSNWQIKGKMNWWTHDKMWKNLIATWVSLAVIYIFLIKEGSTIF